VDTLDLINKTRVVTILRGLAKDDALNVIGAIKAGGLEAIEVTFDQRKPAYVTAEIIKAAREKYPELCIGAGTVMTLEQVQAAFEAGAAFCLAPNTDLAIIQATKKLGMVSIPGAMTPSEIADCYKAGADIVKVFPASVLGPGYIKAVRGPLPHIPLEAVGGVNLENMTAFLQAGCCSVGIGSNITDKKAIAAHDYAKITALAREYRLQAESVKLS
jgi:2-dehydro-3-deoxyphosphogluconate aldolase/(4S)-4-hydroxy-2-oxoglutarate aldolase